MPTSRLYLQPIPDGAKLEDQDSLRANVSAQGLLEGGSTVEQLSNQPGDHTLRGQYRCQSAAYAELMARELRELANASGYSAVPLYRTDAESSDDGYYVVERADDVGPVRPQQPAIQQFRLSLSEDGTHETRWSAVGTTPVDLDHPYGTDLDPTIFLPSAASKPQWYDGDSGSREPATATTTVPSEHGDLDVYLLSDGESAVGDAPTLLYELSYADAGVLDPVVWDDRGNASNLSADDVRQWQHVFTTSHEYEGRPILDSGRLRVVVDEAAGVLKADTWDDGAGAWSSVGLDWSNTDWALYDWDVETISPVTVRSQATFAHPTDDLFVLDGLLDRGRDAIQWTIPDSETGPIPAELETVLEPIASAIASDAQPTRALLRREEVRR
jgi:hypothetical protein